MRRWALVVVALYGLALLALTWPVLWGAYSFEAFGLLKPKIASPGDLWEIFGAWPYWIWLGVLLLGQACLLLVPVSAARLRPVTKRSLLPALAASGLLFSVLLASGLLAVAVLLLGEDGKGLLHLDKDRTGEWWERIGWGLLAVLVLAWGAWTWVFHRFSRRAETKDWIASVCRFLLAGSILELLVAVPCHVLVRRRDECCADFGTFWGIAMGIAVMLFSFGPGVFFLYAARTRKLKPG